MRDMERGNPSLLLSARQELRGKLSHQVAVEPNIAGGPEAPEHREQQLRIIEGLPSDPMWLATGDFNLDLTHP
jgi:hypothetical protein